MAIPTGSDFASPVRLGVLRPTSVTISMHMLIPNAPPIRRALRPKRSYH